MLLEQFRHYQAGHLPVSGGVGDQPHFLMQGIQLIEQRVAANDRKKKRAT